jgi:hypothetical protein
MAMVVVLLVWCFARLAMDKRIRHERVSHRLNERVNGALNRGISARNADRSTLGVTWITGPADRDVAALSPAFGLLRASRPVL